MQPASNVSPGAPLSAERLVLNVHDIPAIPGIVADALRILDDPGSSAIEIGEVVQRDQALAAKSLRVVNCAAFGISRKIETIREAIVMIGVRRVRGMVSAMATSGVFAKGIPGLVDPRLLWAHSLETSLWAGEIIDSRKLWSAQSAVIGGLLHDLGIVILCQYATDRYRLVLEKVRDQQVPLPEVEQRELGTTHAVVGATLCAKWQLPAAITQLIQYHHVAKETKERALEVVVMANYLAHRNGAKPFEWAVMPPLPDNLLERLGLDADAMGRLLGRKDAVTQKTHALLEASQDA